MSLPASAVGWPHPPGRSSLRTTGTLPCLSLRRARVKDLHGMARWQKSALSTAFRAAEKPSGVEMSQP
eukprot:7690772-Lingulodinium_polyedra.AAC.1